MPPKEARKYLLAVRASLSETPGVAREYVAALDAALEALSPPKGEGRYEWVFLPDADLTPYEDLNRVNSLSRRIDESANAKEKEWSLTLSEEEIRCLLTALVCYHSILLSVYRERVLQGIGDVMRGLAAANLDA